MLQAKGVHKTYRDGKKELHVLKGIDLEVKEKEIVAIVGPSGAGKSTLLHIMGGIDKPSSGNIFLNTFDLYKMPDNERSKARNRKIGFVFQFYHLLPEFNALENVALPGLIQWPKDPKARSKDVFNKARCLLDECGLSDRLLHRPGELSGGEQQRVAIARAMINSPEILLCDEPTGNLDSGTGDQVLKILLELNRKNTTSIIIVTHDKEISKKADRVIEMKDGMII